MEQGTTLGVVIAYTLIGLFLLVVTLVVLRTVMLVSLLLLAPARQVWARLVGMVSARAEEPRQHQR